MKENNIDIRNIKSTRERKVIEGFRERLAHYIAAGKGNALVILKKQDYKSRMTKWKMELIDNLGIILYHNSWNGWTIVAILRPAIKEGIEGSGPGN